MARDAGIAIDPGRRACSLVRVRLGADSRESGSSMPTRVWRESIGTVHPGHSGSENFEPPPAGYNVAPNNRGLDIAVAWSRAGGATATA